MARFEPSLEIIDRMAYDKPTQGERKLLGMLEGLDNSFEIFFQPHINIAHPDIVILRKKCGCLIIEVKDWNLSSYRRTYGGKLTVKNADCYLSSPFEQVQHYKSELYNRFSASMYIASKKNRNAYGVVVTSVYFSTATDKQVIDLFGCKTVVTKNEKKYDNYYPFWTSEDSTVSILERIKYILRPHVSFSDSMYDDICLLMLPSHEWGEGREPFELDPEKRKLAVPSINGQKILLTGPAGSGKTLVAAQKAINCWRTTRKPVLILTFNVTLRNYIRDCIGRNTRDMSQRARDYAFEIMHMDQFLPDMLAAVGLPKVQPSQFRKSDSGEIDWRAYRKFMMDRLEAAVKRTPKYKTIIVDEGQDIYPKWHNYMIRNFGQKNVDYLITADEKQDIYGRTSLDQKTMRIEGFRSVRIEGSRRLTGKNMELAAAFQKQFLAEKYELDKGLQTSLLTDSGRQQYNRLSVSGPKERAEEIYKIIRTFVYCDGGHSENDICILADNYYMIRALHTCFTTHLGANSVEICCETEAEYNELLNTLHVTREEVKMNKKLKAELDDGLNVIRKCRKLRFNMNSGVIKICTIHSFKGWEIENVVLLLDFGPKEAELIYTGLTRSRRNLIVIDMYGSVYGEFFRREISYQNSNSRVIL